MSKRQTRAFLFDPFGPLSNTEGGGGGTQSASTGTTTTATWPAVVTSPAYAPPATQADLDRIIKDRLDRERAKFADYADLKAKAEAHDKALEDAKTEQEKAVDAARKEGESTARQAADARILRSEAKAAAAVLRFRDPGDAVAFLDLSKVGVDDAGQVDERALKAALEDLAKAKPYLVDDGKPQIKPDGTQGGGRAASARDQGIAQAEKRFGKPKTETATQ